MNLTPRCNEMLPNHCQCPNDSVSPSDLCVLHIELKRNRDMANEKDKEEQKRQQIANES